MLRKTGDPFPWKQPPGMGAEVMLNSGGMPMIVVDLDGDQRTCAWSVDGEVHEFDLPWQCLKPAV